MLLRNDFRDTIAVLVTTLMFLASISLWLIVTHTYLHGVAWKTSLVLFPLWALGGWVAVFMAVDHVLARVWR